MSVHMTLEEDHYVGGEVSVCQKLLLSGRGLCVLLFSKANKHLNEPNYGLLVQVTIKRETIFVLLLSIQTMMKFSHKNFVFTGGQAQYTIRISYG